MINLTDKGTYWRWVCTGTGGAIGTFCQADKPAPITCGSANGGTFSSSGPSSSALCSDGSKPTVSPHYTGSYWTGWSWTCGTNSCSANLSPGVCGSANGTTRTTAPSTAAELCQAGSPGSVSGSGPWTWSCTGTSCSANKTASCSPSCPNPALYCTTTPIYDTNCGTYCGNGTQNCSTPRLIVCPASTSLSPGGTIQLNARYWSGLSFVPSCSTTGYSTVTSAASMTWSRFSGLATTAVVGNGDANGAKGLVTAGSPSTYSSITVRADYSGSVGTATVGVNAAASPTVNVSVQAIPASGSAPLTSTIRATVSGTATGNINYTFNCGNGTTQSFLGESVITKDYNCTYSTAGSYVPTVSVVRQGILANGSTSVTVSAPSGQLLTVSKSGTGTGTITSVPAGISYPGDSSESYATGTAVVLTASPTAGSTFVSWGGDCSGSGTCSVSMTSPKNVTATFDPPTTCSCNDPNVCIGSSYTGTGSGCAPNGCPGTKSCSQHWTEVAP